METESLVDRLLKNTDNMHEFGRQRAFKKEMPIEIKDTVIKKSENFIFTKVISFTYD